MLKFTKNEKLSNISNLEDEFSLLSQKVDNLENDCNKQVNILTSTDSKLAESTNMLYQKQNDFDNLQSTVSNFAYHSLTGNSDFHGNNIDLPLSKYLTITSSKQELDNIKKLKSNSISSSSEYIDRPNSDISLPNDNVNNDNDTQILNQYDTLMLDFQNVDFIQKIDIILSDESSLLNYYHKQIIYSQNILKDRNTTSKNILNEDY